MRAHPRRRVSRCDEREYGNGGMAYDARAIER